MFAKLKPLLISECPFAGGQIRHISILASLAVGGVGLACTIIIHMVPVMATVNLVRREKSLGHVGMPWADLRIFARVVFLRVLSTPDRDRRFGGCCS